MISPSQDGSCTKYAYPDVTTSTQKGKCKTRHAVPEQIARNETLLKQLRHGMNAHLVRNETQHYALTTTASKPRRIKYSTPAPTTPSTGTDTGNGAHGRAKRMGRLIHVLVTGLDFPADIAAHFSADIFDLFKATVEGTNTDVMSGLLSLANDTEVTQSERATLFGATARLLLVLLKSQPSDSRDQALNCMLNLMEQLHKPYASSMTLECFVPNKDMLALQFQDDMIKRLPDLPSQRLKILLAGARRWVNPPKD